ncbi:transcriptional regulator [Planotetraspora thailandica]|uniref:Transcriptional regulator n=2 Tax=Planotetraspora thailandica TaxID=487172 RepID=A0A8J3VF97_9ACTN|nr:transcriptional regulator [Planotetraspora thailandica]
MLAQVSVDYYIRLEQGRERHPSDQVLDALAQALRLEPEATEHLHRLAHAQARKRGPVDQVDPNLLRLVQGWDHTPAFIVNRRCDVLARNSLSEAVCGWLEHSDNLLRMIFLNPASQELLQTHWEQEASSHVAHLHAMAGADYDDPFLVELVEELSLVSGHFRRMWARHDVRARSRETVRVHHPDVGELTLRFEGFSANSTPGQSLVIGHTDPGSPSADALAQLGRLTLNRS